MEFLSQNTKVCAHRLNAVGAVSDPFLLLWQALLDSNLADGTYISAKDKHGALLTPSCLDSVRVGRGR